MNISGVSLQHFRNYQQQTFLFPKRVTVIVGNNGRGKTSIIEAINLLATGNSFRAEEVAEMVKLGADLARVQGKVSTQGEETTLEVLLTRGFLDGKKVYPRFFSVNQVKRRKQDFVGKILTVVFRPEDMRLIEGSPQRRRQFIDTVLAVIDTEYAQSLKLYEDGLKRRNRLLSQVQEGAAPRTVLSFWTSLLLKHGQILQKKRQAFCDFFSSVPYPMRFELEFLPSVISEERVNEYADREVAAGHTLIGPHKDDFVVKMFHQDAKDFLPVHIYGSRGQQRLAVLWLKMGELIYLQKQTGNRPILLLDDILSELDEEHRQQVFSLLAEGQAIITTTEPKVVAEIEQKLSEVEIVNLE